MVKQGGFSYKDAHFLNIPVNPFAEEIFVRVFAEGKQIDEQKLPISPCPAMWAPIPLGIHAGKEITVVFEENGEQTEHPELMQWIELSDHPHDSETLYQEPLRPLAHFSARRGFINDPNGLFCWNGIYHLFFQHNPYGLRHGNTHWGHAISSDLIHWEELGTALFPDRSDGLIFSGSAVVDERNTSGLQQGQQPPILLFYTATGARFFPKMQTPPKTKQCVAYSVDGGLTFRKYQNNPILDEIVPMNRDPKVVWNRDAGCWVMALYLSDHDFTLLYSDNLLNWKQGERITLPASGECPDLFELYVDGNESDRKWVFFSSPENYVIGRFDGRRFCPETETIKGPTQIHGETQKAFLQSPAYAPQTFFGISGERVIQLSWITTAFPGMPFAGCMSLPWELRLVRTPCGCRLAKSPAREASALRGARCAGTAAASPAAATAALAGVAGEALDLTVDAQMRPEGRLAIAMRGVLIVYDHTRRTLLTPTGKYSLPITGDLIDLRVIADRGSIELFCCGGLFNCVLNSPLDPTKRNAEFLELDAVKTDIKLYSLRAIWPTA